MHLVEYLTGVMPLITGPVAAIIFLFLVRTKRRWIPLMFCIVLLIVDLSFLLPMAMFVGHSFPGAGYIAHHLLPITAVVSLVILLLPMRSIMRGPEQDAYLRISYMVGTILISFTQLLMAAVFPMIWSSLIDLAIRLGVIP